MIFQLEVGETGTPHFQGYVEFKQPLRIAAMKKICPRAHFEIAKGSQAQNKKYCTKEEGRLVGPWEYGNFQAGGSGARNDLAAMITTADSTHDLREVIRSDPVTYIKFHRGIEAYMFHTRPSRTIPPKVMIFYGPTGTGKTKKAFEKYNEVLYRKAPDTTWFDGYYGQSCLLLDDFAGRASKMSLSYLLQLLDRYPIDVQVKGSYVGMLATTIIITTNIHPSLWYDYANREGQYKALARRIHEVWYFPELGEGLYTEHFSFFENWFESCDEGSVLKNITRPNTPVPSDDEQSMDVDYVTLEA